MSVLFQAVVGTGKLYTFRKTFAPSLAVCKCLARKYSESPPKFKTFDEVVEQRRAEARRSLVVQVNSEASFNELYGYCSQYGSIDGVHHYKNKGGEHFMLIEFSTEENLREVLKNCGAHQKDVDVMALLSPFLWFRAVPGKKGKLTFPAVTTPVAAKQGTLEVDEESLLQELTKCGSMSEQIQMLYDHTVLNDLGVRLRYLVARQLEMTFESLYANVAVRPFGSSVNGFGRSGCDLDLVLTNTLTDDMTDSNKRLIYQEKKPEGGVRPWRLHLELIGTLLEMRVAGASRVQRVLLARVPIVKYAHIFAGVDCDLCYRNMSGVYMSELLWLYGSLDPRVRPLTFAVRRWAQAVGLTNAHPGRWVTNFPLTLMVIFFLQQRGKEGSVLPSVKSLVRMAEKQDTRISEDNINCTFVRDLNRLPSGSYSQNPANLQTLLLQFFEFYSQFDFQDKAISINEGVPIRKPNASPLYVVNPLEQALNVSRNVSFEECERLKMEVRNAVWQLESDLEGSKSDDWGILSLIEKSTTRGLKKLLRVGNSHRLVSVKDLFSDDDKSNPIDDSLKSRMQRLSKKEVEESVKEIKDTLTKEERREQKLQQLKFKNRQVANEVYRIRRDKMI